MSKVTINGKEYNIKPYSFGIDCDLDEIGVSIADLKKRSKTFIRAYFAVSAGISKEKAGEEINQHIINGGNLEELSNAIVKEIGESDFFRKAIEESSKATETSQSKETETATEA